MAPAFYTLFIFDQLGKEKSSFPSRFAVRRRREKQTRPPLARERDSRERTRTSSIVDAFARLAASCPFVAALRTYKKRRIARQLHTRTNEPAHTVTHAHTTPPPPRSTRLARIIVLVLVVLPFVRPPRLRSDVKSCSLETSFLQSRGSKRAGLKRFIFLAMAANERTNERTSEKRPLWPFPKKKTRLAAPSRPRRDPPLRARATSRAVRS